MQLRTAYLTDEGAVCLEIGAQNGRGGISVSRVVYVTPDWKGAKRLSGHWLDESGFGGSASADFQRDFGGGFEVDRWRGVCQKAKAFSASGGDMKPGKDVTDKVNEALKRAKQ
ncbi:MAG: hypothetical protein WBQ46_01250 [Terriglobales bacterium]